MKDRRSLKGNGDHASHHCDRIGVKAWVRVEMIAKSLVGADKPIMKQLTDLSGFQVVRKGEKDSGSTIP